MHRPADISAFGIIAAGGTGERMGQGRPKAETVILGKSLFFYSLAAFEDCVHVSRVVVVMHKDSLASWSAEKLGSMGFKKVIAVIEGGKTRQESVAKGLEFAPDEGVVVIHDGARPLVTPEMVEAVCNIPEGAQGVITAVEVTDTIKELREGEIVRTLDRSNLSCAQTPQAFLVRALREGQQQALSEGFLGTDDASLIERIGGRILTVPGSRENLKVTFKEDIDVAEALLSKRSRA